MAINEPESQEAAIQAVVPVRQRRPARITPHNIVVGLILIGIVAAGFYYRNVGYNWDDYTHLHPDERFLTGVTDAAGGAFNPTGDPDAQDAQSKLCAARYPGVPLNGSTVSIFDSQCSSWYPKNSGNGLYVYGELPLFIVKFVVQTLKSQALAQAQNITDPAAQQLALTDATYRYGYTGLQIIGRHISAIADTIAIFFLFLIGRRLYNDWIGLLAAALYACAVLPIQLSHFWTADAFTNLPVVIAFWFAVRAMDRGKWYEFAGFGVAMGAAVASRINVLPLFGVGGLAAIIYALPYFDGLLAIRERQLLLRRAIIGVVLASVFMLGTFRVAMPHAFTGGPGILGFFNITPYGPWLSDLGTASTLSSGGEDFPPDHQWASRTPYLFPLSNIVLWGAGVPLGVAAVLGWLWAAIQTLRGRPLWTRHILPVVWILVYFGYMGRQWVMTMRYFMPLYPFFALLAAWALYEAATRSWHWMRSHPTIIRRAVAVAGTLALVVVVAGTTLWATMFVRIYQRELTRVEASRYVQRNMPSGVSTTLTTTDGKITRLVNMQLQGGPGVTVTAYKTSDPQLTSFLPKSRTTVDRVVVSHLSDPDHGTLQKQFDVAIATNADGSSVIGHGVAPINANSQPDGNSPFTVMLDQPVALNTEQTYYLMTWTDGPLTVWHEGANTPDFTLSDANQEDIADLQLPSQQDQGDGSMATFGDQPAQASFTAPLDGTIDHFNLTHLLNATEVGTKADLSIQVMDQKNPGQVLDQGTLKGVDASSTKTSPYGDSFTIPLDKPLTLKENQKLTFQITSTNAVRLQVTGTVIAWEGDWDDPVPWKVCALPPEMELTHDTPSDIELITCDGIDGFGSWYWGPKTEMSGEDDDTKRNTIETALDQADYYVITSNRFYDSEARIPMRYPMTIQFYKELFANKTGFDLLKTFTSYPSIGNFEIADQNLPTYNSPAWVNEFESEEAFSVYDHPTVFLFKKDANYNPKVVASILTSVETTPANDINVHMDTTPDATLVNRITWKAKDSSPAPTGLQLTPDLRAIQTQGGTWADLFNRSWTINSSPLVTVIIWWLVIMLFGLAAWPLVFVLLPGLPDRGYPFTKLVGLLVVAWIVWAGGTLRLLTWSQFGIALTLIGLAVVSAVIYWRNRQAMMDFMRLNWRHIAIIELVTAIMFLAFLFLKLGNPDLWAQSLGGEKPMDFAYFNAVLRSTVFPPYDPWYAGGYLNYYYFGFVLVGTPVKLLGVVPSVAYNLIIPTLFALTGMGAFSVAFNIVASRWFYHREEGSDGGQETSLQERRRFALKTPLGSPYLAGTMALLLCVVLGNLDTPRVFLTGVAQAGGYSNDSTSMYDWKVNQFTTQNSRPPSPEEAAKIQDEVNHPGIGDQIGYSLYDTQRMLTGLSQGIGTTLGSGIPTDPNRWFWGPTRVVGELPNNSNEINEMPFFTFIFADLHAHMLAFPLTLLALAWMLSEVLAAGYLARSTLFAIASTIFGGLIIGVLQATNTWDWITYLLLGYVAMLGAIILRRQRLGKRTMIAWGAMLGGFFVAQWFFALPFTHFWATSILGSNALQSFTGNKTPIWAYFDINGLFIFIIVSMLIWQTARLLRRVYVRDFIGRSWPLLLIAGAIVVTILVSVFIASAPAHIALLDMPIPLALVCIPLLAWTVILFLIPDQSREVRIVYVLIALGLAISFGVEVVVLGADIGRQNTFFKFYLQIWILFSVASGVVAAWLFQASEHWHGVVRTPWLAALTILLAIAGLFPVMATEGKTAVRMAPNAPHTLDGDAYMNYATYYEGSTPMPLHDDLQIIQWLQNNIQGSPVILEGYESEYKLGARISINTGLPTIIGWRFHQSQQRTIDPLPNIVWQRVYNVTAMYTYTDIATIWKMLQFYNVEYIIDGKLEQGIYPPDGIAKFDQMVSDKLLEVVYNQNGDKIYHVIPGATLPALQVGG